MDLLLRVAGAVFLVLVLTGGLAVLLAVVIGVGIWLGLLIAALVVAGLVGYAIWLGAARVIGSRPAPRTRPE